jgi:hypothetical protein
MPKGWAKEVQDQMKKMKAFSGTVRNYTGVQQGTTQSATTGTDRGGWTPGAPTPAAGTQTGDPLRGTLGEPRPAQEGAEQQIDRIERLLGESDPSYDLRIYSIRVDVSVQKDLGGEIQETQTEIRGIEGVTTVRTVGDTRDIGPALVATYEVKFELLGAISRVRFRDKILIPGLMRIKGLKMVGVSPIHRTNVRGSTRTVRETLKEYGGVANFGGAAGNLGMLRKYNVQTSVTPRETIQSVLDDWVEASVQVYDAPTNTTDMRYHVMMPVEELLPLISRVFRAPMDAFDGMYQHFIANGAENPVYIALGKNNVAKVTGNEDLIWFAKRAGLEELPVFFSYQRQA